MEENEEKINQSLIEEYFGKNVAVIITKNHVAGYPNKEYKTKNNTLLIYDNIQLYYSDPEDKKRIAQIFEELKQYNVRLIIYYMPNILTNVLEFLEKLKEYCSDLRTLACSCPGLGDKDRITRQLGLGLPGRSSCGGEQILKKIAEELIKDW